MFTIWYLLTAAHMRLGGISLDFNDLWGALWDMRTHFSKLHLKIAALLFENQCRLLFSRPRHSRVSSYSIALVVSFVHQETPIHRDKSRPGGPQHQQVPCSAPLGVWPCQPAACSKHFNSLAVIMQWHVSFIPCLLEGSSSRVEIYEAR